jgi:hypothetical protein
MLQGNKTDETFAQFFNVKGVWRVVMEGKLHGN